jgi:hypothetical protein
METLTIAVEVVERDGLPRDDHYDCTVHAYDIAKQDFAYHQLPDTSYTVKPYISWEVAIQWRMRLCSRCDAAHRPE